MTTATLAGTVDARISGEVSGQVAVGNNIVQYNVEHGGVVNVAAPEQLPDPQPRPLPLPASLRGRRPRKLLGRESEVVAAGNALVEGVPVQFYGPPGIGKTTLLKTLAHLPGEDAADGVIYHDAHGEVIEDTLQFLYEAFYESKVPFKATEAQIRHGLGGVRARLVVDDLGVGRSDLTSLLDALPSSSFVVAAPRRTLWDGEALALRGLAPDAAVALLERELDRTLEGDQRSAAMAIATALEGEALRLLQVAGLVTEHGHDLRALADQLTATGPERLTGMLEESLDADQAAIYDMLTALGGASLPAAELAEITGIANAADVVESLNRMGLTKAHSPRYSVTDATAAPRDTGSWEGRLVDYFCGWAERNRAKPEKVAANAAAVLAVLGTAARNQASADLLRLGRAVEGPLVLTGRWGAWQQVVGHELTAARRVRDRAGEGWALHQLGTRALCLGDFTAARSQLNQALRIRESLGDLEGAEATRHNLRLLPSGGPIHKGAAYVATRQPEPPPRRPAAVLPAAGGIVGLGIPLLAIIALVITAALVVGGLVIAGARSSDDSDDGSSGASALTVSPGRHDFGERAPSNPSPPRAVSVTNGGDDAVDIEGVALTGASEAYRIESDTCTGTQLRRAASCRVAVVFNPPRSGTFDASMIVRSGGRDGPATTLSGTGTGTDPTTDGQVGPLRIEPGTVNFGRQVLDGPGRIEEVRVLNAGSEEMRLRSVNLTGTNREDFIVSGNGCLGGPLGAQARCTIQVRFLPTVAGDRRARVAVVAGAPGADAVVDLAGVGVGPGRPEPPVACSLQPPPAQTVAYGAPLQLTARAGGPSTPAFTAQGLPAGLSLVDNRDGTATISGTVLAIPGSYNPTLNALVDGRPCRSASFPITVGKAPVSVTWPQALLDITPGSPATARALVVQTGGTAGEITNATVTFDVTNTLTREVRNLGSYPVDRAGAATLTIAPGQLPAGTYTARARVDPSNPYFRMASPVPIAVVVNTDVLGTSIYALTDLLNQFVPTA